MDFTSVAEESRQRYPGSHGAQTDRLEDQAAQSPDPPQQREQAAPHSSPGTYSHYDLQRNAVHGKLPAEMERRQSSSRPQPQYASPANMHSPGSEVNRGWNGTGWGPVQGSGNLHHRITSEQWSYPHLIPTRDSEALDHVRHCHGVLADSDPTTRLERPLDRLDVGKAPRRPQTAQPLRTGGGGGISMARPRTSDARRGRGEGMTRPLTPSEAGVEPTVSVGTDGTVSGFTISSMPKSMAQQGQDDAVFTHRVRRWKRVPVVGSNRLGDEVGFC